MIAILLFNLLFRSIVRSWCGVGLQLFKCLC